MVSNTFEQELMNIIRDLSSAQQQDVLNYARAVGGQPKGTPGSVLIERARTINWPKEDLEAMKAAMADCERIDWDEWE